MQKQKKSAAVILIVALLIFAVPVQVFGLEFVDVPVTASYYKAVDKLSNVGVIQGRGDGVFAPKDRTTRAEFCAFLARANGYNANYYTPKELPFPDVDKKGWALPYISYCYENGYINGMLDGTFCPNDFVTHEQAIKMVVCSSGVGDESLAKVGPKWYSGYINVAQKYDLLNGTNIRISDMADRAFVAQVVYNAMVVADERKDSVQDAVNVGNDSRLPETPAPSSTIIPEPTRKPSPTVNYDEDAEEPEATKKPKPTKKPLPTARPGGYLIVIDAGHNYSVTDTGASSEDMREQDITFYIADKTRELLEANGFVVIMTREKITDNVSEESVSASLRARAELANEAEADAFVSIHCNAGGATGTESYYYSNSDEGPYLAEAIHENILELIDIEDRGVKTASFVVLKETAMVSALVETAFIDNEKDAALLRSSKMQWKFAEGIARGICEYFEKEYID